MLDYVESLSDKGNKQGNNFTWIKHEQICTKKEIIELLTGEICVRYLDISEYRSYWMSSFTTPPSLAMKRLCIIIDIELTSELSEGKTR